MELRTRQWIVMCVVALAVSGVAAFLLPIAEADGYSYAEEIARRTAQISAGHLRIVDLYGFWLPLFQLTASLVNVGIDNPMLAGKLISAFCGATSSVLVFVITKKLTRSFLLASIGFALILFNPLHLLYSAASMTDVPGECLVLASLLAVLRKRWVLAAIFGAAAESVRVEPWTLMILLPLIQFAYERRVSILAVAILIFPPLLWLAISQLATGNTLEFFSDRARYQASYLDFFPARRGFALADVRQDISYFLFGANRVVVVSILAAAGLSILSAIGRRRRPAISIAAPLAYIAALFGFLFLAYVTKGQPVIFPRYALLFFALGIPLLLWLVRLSIKRWARSWLIKSIAVAVLLLCVRETKGQLLMISKVFGDFRAHRQVAAALAAVFNESPHHEQRCFSDDPATRLLSRLPLDRFVRSATAPSSAWQNSEQFQLYLEQEHVAFLVFTRIENSLPVKFLPELGRNADTDVGRFQFMTVAVSPFASDVWLYRLRRD
jgi:hypothetical protein